MSIALDKGIVALNRLIKEINEKRDFLYIDMPIMICEDNTIQIPYLANTLQPNKSKYHILENLLGNSLANEKYYYWHEYNLIGGSTVYRKRCHVCLKWFTDSNPPLSKEDKKWQGDNYSEKWDKVSSLHVECRESNEDNIEKLLAWNRGEYV
jgi:hypothetical protein